MTSTIHPSRISSHLSHPQIPNDLASILEQTPTSSLSPLEFFISWNGVLTLAYSGWTESLLDLKTRLNATPCALPPESPGSRWPKTSIGCLHDHKSLTFEEFINLRDLCKNISSQLFSTTSTPIAISIDSATVGIYTTRCLETLWFQHTISFAPFPTTCLSSSFLFQEEQDRIKQIVCEAFTDPTAYFSKVDGPGNRASHYTAPAMGVTLFHGLVYPPHRHPLLLGSNGCSSGSCSEEGRSPRVVGTMPPTATTIIMSSPPEGVQKRGLVEIRDRRRLVEAVQRFRDEVELLLPGYYRWFEDTSLHVTLRGVIL